MISQLHAAKQKELLDFAQGIKNKKPKTFGEDLLGELVEQILSGNLEIKGIARNEDDLFVHYGLKEKIWND